MVGISKVNSVSTGVQNCSNNEQPNNAVSFPSNPVNTYSEIKKPINPLLWLGLGIIAPFAAFFGGQHLSGKSIKSDKQDGIDFKDVNKVLDNMLKENKVDESKLKVEFTPIDSEESKKLLKEYGGGVYLRDTTDGTNIIRTATERASLSLHETGHVINQTCTTLGKLWAKFIHKTVTIKSLPKAYKTPLGVSSIIAGALFGIGYFSYLGKNKDQNSKTNHFSLTKFINENIGKLTLLVFSPLLMDEAMASYRALKAAKKVAPNMLKPLRKNLLLAFSTYVLTAAGTIASNMLFRKAFDEFYHKKAATSNP